MLGQSDGAYWFPEIDWIWTFFQFLWPWLWPIIRYVMAALVPFVIYKSMMSFSDDTDEQQEQQESMIIVDAPSLPVSLPSMPPRHDVATLSPSSSSSGWEMPSPSGSSSVRVRAVKQGFPEMA